MRCENCGRLSPDTVNVCKYCGSVFDESKPAEKVTPNNQIAYEIDNSGENAKPPKYFKSGWLVALAVVAVIALIIIKII